jgi:hypothetical protein
MDIPHRKHPSTPALPDSFILQPTLLTHTTSAKDLITLHTALTMRNPPHLGIPSANNMSLLKEYNEHDLSYMDYDLSSTALGKTFYDA